MLMLCLGEAEEGHLFGCAAAQDDVEALQHAALGGHGVVLVSAAQKDGACPVPAQRHPHHPSILYRRQK